MKVEREREKKASNIVCKSVTKYVLAKCRNKNVHQ